MYMCVIVYMYVGFNVDMVCFGAQYWAPTVLRSTVEAQYCTSLYLRMKPFNLNTIEFETNLKQLRVGTVISPG